MLEKLLEQKKCFKLICGAGNENLQEVERLVALYAKAGCHFFDLSASKDVLAAAQKGLDFSIPKSEQQNYHFCISIGTQNDQHVCKVEIDFDKCKNCGKCVDICPQNAIIPKSRSGLPAQQPEIIAKNCIGCLKCKSVCTSDAIFIPHLQSFNLKEQGEQVSYPNIDHLIFDKNANLPNLSCIELHASDTDEREVDEIWQHLNDYFDGLLSICIGRSILSNEQILKRIKRLIKDRKPYTTIIQADGSPMSGGDDDFKTTLQAVAMAEIIQNANLPVYLLLSGGTNSKTAELAKLCGVDFNGIAIGSYARKIVKEFITRDDFFENKLVFGEALKVAKTLVG